MSNWNAIRHGIAPVVGAGRVRVRGWSEGGMVHIAVTDSGPGQSREPGTGEGLDNVRRRLRARFGARSDVRLSTVPGATEALVMFPMIEAGS